MKRFFILVGMVVAFLLFSCSSSKSQNDTDILPDYDEEMHDSETVDDDSDSQSSKIVDDSEGNPNEDIEPDETSNEIFEKTEPINGYARCYDKIPAGDYEGFFASSKLESKIKQILGYDDDYELKEEDLEKITEIKLSVKDIRGVEKLINLESVQISTGKIYDYTPLSKLKKLKKLVIYASSMSCLDASFSLLTSLETLEIEETKLKDISPVEQLVNLTSLAVRVNEMKSLPENIGNLQKLESISFIHNNVQDIIPLKSLTNLKRLFFNYNQIEDISPIKDLVNLTNFFAQGNKIKDISAVTNLVNLTYLGLNNNQIEAIPEDFVNLKKLQTCELDYNNISNLPDLQGLDSLTEMALSGNDLNDEDLMKLDGLENVRFLYVALNKKITKVPVMKNLKSLQELYLNYNSITDLSGFADNESFPALKSVYLGSNKISDAEALRKRKGLNRLSIGNNCIKDLSPLEDLKERGTYISGMNEQLESCEDK